MIHAENSHLGFHTEAEIRSMPEIWRTLTAPVHTAVSGLAETARRGPVVLLGCGSGYFAARFGQALLDRVGVHAHAHISSDYVQRPPASSLELMRENPRPVAIALSRSGETSETLSAVRAFRRRGGSTVIAVTCRPNSALAREADTIIDLRDADESAVPQTRSVSAMWLSLLLLAGVCADQDLRTSIADVAEATEAAADHLWSTLSDLAADGDGQVLLGSGLGHVLAGETALKMVEMGRIPAWAYRTLEYRHGPLEALQPGTTLVGAFGDDLTEAELKAVAEAAGATDRHLNVQEIAPQQAGPVGMLAQLYVAHTYSLLLSRRRGFDADRPANIREHVGDVWLEEKQ